MNLDLVLDQLRKERLAITIAIESLESIATQQNIPNKRGPGRPVGSTNNTTQRKPIPINRRGPKSMSAASRKRISDMMKRRWAERRKNAA